MWRYLKRVLIGKPLKTLDEGQTHLTKFKALAMLSSDAISSVAYGPEQITTVLVTLSAAAKAFCLWTRILSLPEKARRNAPKTGSCRISLKKPCHSLTKTKKSFFCVIITTVRR